MAISGFSFRELKIQLVQKGEYGYLMSLSFLIPFLFLLSSCVASYEHYMQKGLKETEKGSLQKASDSYQLALLAAKNERKDSGSKKARALLGLSACQKAMGNEEECLSFQEKAAFVYEEEGIFQKAAELRLEIGKSQLRESKKSDAAAQFDLARAALDKGGLQDSHESALLSFAYADLKSLLGAREEAAALIEEGLSIMERTGDEDYQSKVSRLYSLSAIYQELGRDSEAVAAEEKARAIQSTGIKNAVFKKVPRL